MDWLHWGFFVRMGLAGIPLILAFLALSDVLGHKFRESNKYNYFLFGLIAYFLIAIIGWIFTVPSESLLK
jgi:hypothetical protein